MESEAQKVEAMKQNAKYRRHVMKKRKHERNMAQAKEHEEHRSHYRKRSDFDHHRIYAPAAKLKNVTSGRLSVPRGLFLKGKTSSVLKKTGDAHLNALNYARKKENLGQIIKIGMDQAQKINNRVCPKRKSGISDPVKRLHEEADVMNDETVTTQEAKRKKNVGRIKTVLGLADPAPSFMLSPTADAQGSQFVVGGIPTPGHPLVKTKAHEKSESPWRSPNSLDSQRDVRAPDRNPSQKSCNILETEEKVDEMDDLFLEKLVSDIGLYAWNSQKPSSEPYENCDERLIKEIMSLRDVSLNEMAKCNQAKEAEQPRKISETITSHPTGLLQSTPKPADFKLAACDDEEQSPWDSDEQTGFTTNKGKSQQKMETTQSYSVGYSALGDCYRYLFTGKEAETSVGGAEGTGDERAGIIPFVSPSTPPIAARTFDPKAFMQDVEVQREPQEEFRCPSKLGCSTGGGCGNSRHFDRSGSSHHFDRSGSCSHFHRSEDEFNVGDYESALSQCYEAEVTGRSDDSDISCNLYKYRRAMY